MRPLLPGLLALLLVSCSSAGGVDPQGEAAGEGSGGGGDAGQGGDGGAGGDAGQGGGVNLAGQSGGASKECGDDTTSPAEVYAHSASTLFRIDAATKGVTTVGKFSGCGADVIDIALDREGKMIGTTFQGLVRIDKTTAACTIIQGGSYPNSLSFVPAGTIFPDKEALVGYKGATYVRIDPDSGAIATQGSLGSGDLQSSGDIVSVIGGGTYLTVNGGGCADCIVRVDPVTGALLENLGTINYPSVYGLAFWGGELYGFNSLGKVFVYDLSTKNSIAVTIPGAPSGLSFYGAGSTTCARLTKPIN